MSHQMNNHFDTDLDAYLTFDQGEQTPMSSTSDVKPIPALLHQSSAFSSSNEAFSGPTYQYDSHRQQTGLPMGGYANTLAVNQASGLHYRPSNMGFVMPTQTLNIPLSNLDEFDFNRPQFDYPEMDIETESQTDLPSMFYDDNQSGISPSSQMPPRMYPGMHTKQAAQAAKLQQAQKESAMMKQQEKQLPAGQKPLPTSAPKSPTVKDPHVEESISRLLNRMRQSSNASADDDEDSPVGGMSGMPRMKKDEEDMDDDERLLNSEEGKKLTSKERRQLRNKVSARAFRSRRKEYITQLESEVATKVQEANELRVQNRQLMEENTRLTDLTRMLLSSQAFSGFLQELSQSGNAQNIPQHQALQQAQPPQQPSRQAQPQQQSQPQSSRKDVSSHEASRQMQNLNQHMQVGMTLIPETPIDMSVFDGHNMWNTMMPSNDFQVFSVMELPEPPKLDMTSLSGKSTTDESVFKSPAASHKDVPVISSLPAPAMEDACDLYTYDSAPTTASSTSQFSGLSKSSVSSASISTVCSSTTGSWSHLMQLCKGLDDSCERLANLMN